MKAQDPFINKDQIFEFLLSATKVLSWLLVLWACLMGFLSLTVLFSSQVPRLNFLDLTEKDLPWITTTLTATIFTYMGIISYHLRDLKKQVSSMQKKSSGIIEKGIRGVIPLILKDLEPVHHKHQTIRVLGLHLGSAWDSILRGLIRQDNINKYELELLCLDPEYIKNSVFIPAEWENKARNSIKAIKDYADNNSALLKNREIKIKLYTYKIFPAIHGFFNKTHGFFIDTESMYIACIHWGKNKDSLKVTDPDTPYERFIHTDRSQRANFYRNLFENWWLRALEDATLEVDSSL